MARMLITVHTRTVQRLLPFALVATVAFATGSLLGASRRLDWLVPTSAQVAAPPAQATWVDPNNPIRTAASSAYDGRSSTSVRPAVVWSGYNPIVCAACSAYDGTQYMAARRAVALNNTPPVTSAGRAAEHGQTGKGLRAQVQPPNWHNPITCAACSAYQPTR